MRNKLRQFGAAIGIFTATVLITYAASSLIPTYAPGENPPNLDQAPLLYRMAGQTDPDNFDYANDSLKAIGDTLESIDTATDGIGNRITTAQDTANTALTKANQAATSGISGCSCNYTSICSSWALKYGSSGISDLQCNNYTSVCTSITCN